MSDKDTDIVERLRAISSAPDPIHKRHDKTVGDAMREITRLRTENERLRGKVEHSNDSWDSDGQAIKFLEESGVHMTRSFHHVTKCGRDLTNKEASAVSYLVWEWDFGGYVGKPTKEHQIIGSKNK